MRQDIESIPPAGSTVTGKRPERLASFSNWPSRWLPECTQIAKTQDAVMRQVGCRRPFLGLSARRWSWGRSLPGPFPELRPESAEGTRMPVEAIRRARCQWPALGLGLLTHLRRSTSALDRCHSDRRWFHSTTGEGRQSPIGPEPALMNRQAPIPGEIRWSPISASSTGRNCPRRNRSGAATTTDRPVWLFAFFPNQRRFCCDSCRARKRVYRRQVQRPAYGARLRSRRRSTGDFRGQLTEIEENDEVGRGQGL